MNFQPVQWPGRRSREVRAGEAAALCALDQFVRFREKVNHQLVCLWENGVPFRWENVPFRMVFHLSQDLYMFFMGKSVVSGEDYPFFKSTH